MSGFGACQGTTCVCAIRAGLGEPEPGLEQGAPCLTTLGTGFPMSVPDSCLLSGSGAGAGARGSLGAGGSLGAAWPAGAGVSIQSCISGVGFAGEPAHGVPAVGMEMSALLLGGQTFPVCLK